MKVKAVFNSSKNVIGKNYWQQRPDEYIIYTAHWITLVSANPTKKGDSITMVHWTMRREQLRCWSLPGHSKHEEQPPERSILFLSVTAEEQGLLGSAIMPSIRFTR